MSEYVGIMRDLEFIERDERKGNESYNTFNGGHGVWKRMLEDRAREIERVHRDSKRARFMEAYSGN